MFFNTDYTDFRRWKNNKIITPCKSAFQAYTTDYTDFRRWKKIKLSLRVNPR